MLSNYLKIAFRNLIRQRGYSIINILGLAVGMTVCILIFIWVQYQFTYDKFNENLDDIYWVCTYYHLGDQMDHAIGSPPAVGPALVEDFPEIINFTRYLRTSDRLIKYGDRQFRERMRGVDPGYFEMFTFPFIQGDPETALDDPYSLVISQEIAEKYFGDENPVGKVVTWENTYDFTITGVTENLPDNTTLGANIYFPMAFSRVSSQREDYIDTWSNCAFYNLVQLQKGANWEEVSLKIRDRIRQSDPETNLESFLFPYKRLHLHWISGEGGLIETVQMFSIIGLLILSIAIINFVNLMTARAGRRAREVGLRKVVGARRTELIKQFIGESLLHAFAACFVAIALVELLLPTFSEYMGDALRINYFVDWQIILGILSITLLTGLASGSYPAFFLASFQPVKSLKGGGIISVKRSWFRRILVVSQFVISIILIISTTIIYQQHGFMKNKEVGFNRNQVVYLPMNTDMAPRFAAVKNELLSHPGIQYVTRSTHSPTGIYWNGEGWDWDGRDPNLDVFVTYVAVDADYLETMGMEMAEGRFYSSEQSAEGTSGNIIINETFADIIGRENIIGRSLTREEDNHVVQGVVKDFNFKPLSNSIGALVIIGDTDRTFSYLFMRISGQDTKETITHIGTVWETHFPEYPLEYHFLDEDYDEMYQSVEQFGDILRSSAFLAILISCLGLFGLACYSSELRTKEIGIRKVLGATVTGLVRLMSKEFVILVVLANAIACPLAYFTMSNWLRDYPYRAELSMWIFIGAAASSLIITVLTVSYQAIRSATASPVKSLRYE